MHILRTRFPELIFPRKYKNSFKVILKLNDKQEQLLNVLQASLRFIAIMLQNAPQVQHSTFKLSFISIKYKPNIKVLFPSNCYCLSVSDSLFLIPFLLLFSFLLISYSIKKMQYMCTPTLITYVTVIKHLDRFLLPHIMYVVCERELTFHWVYLFVYLYCHLFQGPALIILLSSHVLETSL